MQPKGLNERTLIADIFAPLAEKTPGALNLKDDAAYLVPPIGKDLIITTDVIVAGVHFIGDEPAYTIAAKALRVNLSDLAAKGAQPLGYSMCLSLTEDCDFAWVRDFADGLRQDQQAYGISLWGGDTVKTPGPLSISIMAFGTVDRDCMIKRNGAQAGHGVYVTGTIGDGVAGLAIARRDTCLPPGVLNDSDRHYLLHRYRCPEPRCALVPALAEFASAAMDVSDGLIGDIGALVTVSKVSADIFLPQVPLSPVVKKLVAADGKLLTQVVTGGDDYEIICTVPEKYSKKFEGRARQCDVAVCKIGVITKGVHPPRFFDNDGTLATFRCPRFEH